MKIKYKKTFTYIHIKKMYLRCICNFAIYILSNCVFLQLSQRITNILNRYTDLKDAHIPTLTNQHSFKVSQFHKTLKATFGQALIKLQVKIFIIKFKTISIKLILSVVVFE